MEHLFAQWKKISGGFKTGSLYLFLDYDGTIAPIAESPGKAMIPRATREELKRLSALPGCKVAVISGRSLKDLKAMVGLEGITYSGNHGLEVEGPGVRVSFPVPEGYRRALSMIKKALERKLAKVPGVLIEDKGFSLALHFRRVAPEDMPRVSVAFHQATLPYVLQHKVKAAAGKMVLEARPAADRDKGKVVLWLLVREYARTGGKPVSAVYIGDDLTDEDAFFVLREIGLTVAVGSRRGSQARYYLNDPPEVREFLHKLAALKGGRDGRTSKG